MKILILLSLFIFSFQATAYVMSIGTYVPYFQKAQEDADGGEQFFEINPTFTIGAQFKVFGNHYFTPEIGYTYHRNTFDDVDRSTFILFYHLSYPIRSGLILRYGLATFIDKQKSDGGTIRLSNGAGSTDFYKPDQTFTTYHTDLSVGVEFFTGPQNALRFDLYFSGWKEDLIENKSYILTYNFYR